MSFDYTLPFLENSRIRPSRHESQLRAALTRLLYVRNVSREGDLKIKIPPL
jgi:hypothetical protein